LVKEVPHAFDKKPNPISFPKSADRCYSEACAELRRVFGGRSSVEERRQLELSKDVERFEDHLEVGGERVRAGKGEGVHVVDHSVEGETDMNGEVPAVHEAVQ